MSQVKNKLIFIGGDSRSGGSLLARLLDNPPELLSFPLEHEYFSNRNENLYQLDEMLRRGDIKGIISTEYCQKLLKFADRRLKSKQFYDDGDLELNPAEFRRQLERTLENIPAASSNERIYQAIAFTFFNALHNNIYEHSATIVNHSSRAFLTDMDAFFGTFNHAFFIHTIRDPFSFAGSLKNYSYVAEGYVNHNIPEEFLDLAIERWLLGLWHALKNQKEFPGKYLLISYSNLVKDPEKTIAALCEILQIRNDNNLLTPTMGPFSWSGNSSYGKLPQSVSTTSLFKYKDILSKSEIERIQIMLDDMGFDLDRSLINSDLTRVEDYVRGKYSSKEDISSADYFRKLHSTIAKMQLL